MKKSKQYSFENNQKILESNLNCNINSVEYINCKNQLEEVRSKCQWYEEGDFLERGRKETDNAVEISKELERFFENLFQRKLANVHTMNFLEIFTTDLKPGEKKICDEEIGEEEMILAMKSISNNKFPGNDGLTNEFINFFGKNRNNLS